MDEPTLQPHHRKSRLLLERILPATFPIVLVILFVFLFHILPNNKSQGIASLRPVPDPVIVDNIRRRESIKSTFDFAWDGYYRFAFPHDELKPVSNSPGTTRNDWGATAVDALGTAILMGKSDVTKTVLDHVKSIDFNHTDTPISVFESTIRYMGGLLSAYELLDGPFSSLNPYPLSTVLLDQAKHLGDVLSAAFEEGNALPSGHLDPHTLKGSGENSLAGAGTLVSSLRISM
jgi:mannosyl-oligosaccharide alpha-1,2-mannosidase